MESVETLERLARSSFERGRYEEALQLLRRALEDSIGRQHDQLMVSVSACEAALCATTNGPSSAMWVDEKCHDCDGHDNRLVLYNKALGALFAGDGAHASSLLEGVISRKRRRESETAAEDSRTTALLLRDAKLAMGLAAAMDPTQASSPSTTSLSCREGGCDEEPMRAAAVAALGDLLAGRYDAAQAKARLWVGEGEGSLGWAMDEISRQAWLRSLLNGAAEGARPPSLHSIAAPSDEVRLAAAGDAAWTGCLLGARGKPLAALEALQASLASNPSCPVTLFNAAVALGHAGEREGMLRMLSMARDAARKEPRRGISEATVRLAQARLLCEMGRDSEALVEYEALWAEPRTASGVDLCEEYAEACMETTHDRSRAIAILQEGLQHHPDSTPLLIALTEHRIALGDFDAAVSLARRAVVSHRGVRELASLGLALAHNQRPSEALACFEEASQEQTGEDGPAREMQQAIAYNHAVLLLAMGRNAEAARVYHEKMGQESAQTGFAGEATVDSEATWGDHAALVAHLAHARAPAVPK